MIPGCRSPHESSWLLFNLTNLLRCFKNDLNSLVITRAKRHGRHDSFDVSGAKVVGRDGLVIVGAGGKETNAGVESEIRVLFGQDGEDFAVPVRSIPLLVGKRSEAVGADLLI